MGGRTIRALVLLGLFPLFLASCAERENLADVPIQAHSEAFNQPSSGDFHGTRVAAETPASCTTCHGADFAGQGRAPACADCHAGGRSGHPASSEWVSPAGNAFHGLETATTGAAPCAVCHGEDFRGGWSEVSCYRCHDGPSGHPEGWKFLASPNWHGNAVAETGPEPCASCHGVDYRGGTAEVSCFRCHDGPSGHPAGWLSSASERFHGSTWASGGDEACSDCHGNDLLGGTSGVSCADCHSWPLFR